MSSVAQLPPNHTLNQVQNPLAQWNSDELVRTYLRSSMPIVAPGNPVIAQTRLQMLRVRMFELETLRKSIHPATSIEFDRELASVLYKRKLLLWLQFPIRDLPDEILTIIFRFVVWSSVGADEANHHRLYLTWVCRRFRALALSDSTLWNSVWFRDSAPWKRSFAFIERAGTAALDIRIDEKSGPKGTAHDNPPKYPQITVPQIKELLKVLKPRIHQLRILVVVLANIDVVEAFMEGLSKAGPALSLERIEVHRTGQPYLWPREKSEGAGGRLALSEHPIPKLRWLSLNGVTTNWNALPLSNLRTIDLRRMVVQACPNSNRWTEILGASHDLFKLSLDAAGPQLDPKRQRIGHARPADLPSLRDLTIGDMTCIYAVHVLAHMNAPRVMSLALMSLTGQDYGPLLEMLRGRFPEVRMLQLQGLEMAKTDLNMERAVRWFESMPRLKLFRFSQTKPYILDALLADPREYRAPGEMDTRPANGQEDKRPIICPELDTVHFHAQGDADVSTFAKGRKDLGVMLKRVYTPESSHAKIKREEVVRIRASIGQLCVVSHVQMTQEEDAIYEEMANSLGVVRRR
ncbi:hypothetical protein TRAPUB_925 [Trametes pubescens]|uniref:F-box domain-containing protein n=1 Tax=Trametes pubescens TaxID=154538 RepID=A0A1M2VKU9_TRAPU|nr:hypothetical protein TRAPUB_925 [Trametes pubescens]